MLEQRIVSPLLLHWSRVYAFFRWYLLSALLADRPGSFMCLCGNMGVEQTQKKSQHRKVNSGGDNSAASAMCWTHNLPNHEPSALQLSNADPPLSVEITYFLSVHNFSSKLSENMLWCDNVWTWSYSLSQWMAVVGHEVEAVALLQRLYLQAHPVWREGPKVSNGHCLQIIFSQHHF